MGLNVAGAIGGGATIAITIRAIDKYSQEMAKAQGTMQKVGTIMKASAVVGTLALATMTVGALKFASSVKTTDPEIIRLQKSLGSLKTVGDGVTLSFAKGMAPALNEFAVSVKKGQSGLNTLAKGVGSLVGGFFTGLDAIGNGIQLILTPQDVIGKIGDIFGTEIGVKLKEIVGIKEEQAALTEQEIAQNMSISQQYDQYKQQMDLLNAMDVTSISNAQQKDQLMTFINTKYAASLPLLKQQYESEKTITAEKQKQEQLQQQLLKDIQAALKLNSTSQAGVYQSSGSAAKYYDTSGGKSYDLGNGTKISAAPKKAAGGMVEQDGPVYAHKGEMIVPAGNTSNYGGVTINVNGTGDPDSVARAVYKKLQSMGGT